jgi:hypothetical protein
MESASWVFDQVNSGTCGGFKTKTPPVIGWGPSTVRSKRPCRSRVKVGGWVERMPSH